jgi:P-type E1-E2 ATPase
VRNPAVLEQINQCRTVIFDKTGTLTYGEPKVTEQLVQPKFNAKDVLALAASLEVYSKHPLARAILAAARSEGIPLANVEKISEAPGQGMLGTIGGKMIQMTSRGKLLKQAVAGIEHLPQLTTGLECVIAIDGIYAATYRFHDTPRADGLSFIKHLGPKHNFNRAMIVSGDRKTEVHYLAEQVGISEIHAEKSPEEKLAIVRLETEKAKTLYVGDGINDAPAMMAATVGIAVGQNSDVTAEAAGAIVLEGELKRVDEFMHISRRMRIIALQSAVGGMVLSAGGMLFAATGMLTPVAGALLQEAIDVLAILNAIRAAFPPKQISDFSEHI